MLTHSRHPFKSSYEDHQRDMSKFAALCLFVGFMLMVILLCAMGGETS